MRKAFQEKDEHLCKAANSLVARFVKRGGPKVMDLIERNNPCAREWTCMRKKCALYHGRNLLAAEAEEEALKIAERETDSKKVEVEGKVEGKIPRRKAEVKGLTTYLNVEPARREGLEGYAMVKLPEAHTREEWSI